MSKRFRWGIQALCAVLMLVPGLAQAVIADSLFETGNCVRHDTPPLDYVLCNDGLPPTGSTTANVGGVAAVTVPGAYGEDGYTGLPAPCVPDRCRITIDRRFLIEEDLAEVKAEITALLDRVKARRPGFRYEIRDLFEVVPSMTDKDAPIVTSTAAAIGRVLGREADYVVSPGTYDQKHIDRIGKLKNLLALNAG